MKTITMKFPEVKLEIDIEGLTFRKLEALVFDIIRQIGQKVLAEFLRQLDDALCAERPKGKLKNKEKKAKNLETLLGVIPYVRRRYFDRATGACRYLTDEFLGLEKNQRISISRRMLEIRLATEAVFRGTREHIKRLTGSSRSHEAIRRSVIKEAENIIDYQERSFTKTRFLEYETSGETPEVVYNEVDATGIRFQKPRKGGGKRRRKTLEAKLGIGYTGREARYKSGEGKSRKLTRKFVYMSLEGREKFIEKFSLMAERRLNLSAAGKIFFGADGAPWIKRGMRDCFPGVVYILCRFHLYRAIKGALCKRKKTAAAVKKMVCDDALDKALGRIRKIAETTEDIKEMRKLKELHTYIANNRDGIKEGNKRAGSAEMTGAIEPNIDKIIAHRFKKRGMSWSVKGAMSLLKVKEMIVNEDWDKWWYEDRDKTVTVLKEWNEPLSAKHFKRAPEGKPWIEAKVPALEGTEQDKSWAGILRDLTADRYRAW